MQKKIAHSRNPQLYNPRPSASLIALSTRAQEISKEMKSSYIGSEHILLATLEDSFVVKILKGLDKDITSISEKLKKV